MGNITQIAEEAQKWYNKAERVGNMVNSEAWKDLMEVVDSLIAVEIQAALGADLDKKFYEKIGMGQVLDWVKRLPSLIKDKKVVEALVQMGHVKGLLAFQNLPQYFLQRRLQAEQEIKRIYNLDPLTLQPRDLAAEKKQFNEAVHKQS